MREAKRFLGLELAGAKNNKTSLAAIEFYPKERKIFLLDIFDHIAVQDDQTGDEALLEIIREESSGVASIGVNVPLQLPPCINCTRKSCPLPADCTVPAVKWMKEFARKSHFSQRTSSSRSRDFTPYTQRPVELWIRHQVLPALGDSPAFEIDETLGGNRAPLTARMNFLKRHLQEFPLVEVWPKLSVVLLAARLGIPKRIVGSYRHLESGVHARDEILSTLARKDEVFIYDRDLRKLSLSLTAFDAFICAYTALLSDQNQCVKVPKGFPTASGWVQYPTFESKRESC